MPVVGSVRRTVDAYQAGDAWNAALNVGQLALEVGAVGVAYRAGRAIKVPEMAVVGAGEGQTIVGEGMKRVSAAAAQNPGSTILNNMPKFSGLPHQVTSKMMQYNRQ